ncbi:Rmf/CrpP fold protein (plasmid) [Microtetraspora malaysiensis]|uniref:Rmf/CrpP fold protein n=1 Tax=Microtetraspora malaysiensis TaxID=161358 RepID=UPI003D91CC56
MSVSNVDRRAAITFGRLAGERGMSVTACPYSASGDGRAKALRLVWMRSYLRHRPVAGSGR